MPYFGGKRRFAKEIWDRLGDPDIYVEPCGGSMAVLLARPTTPRLEIACDTSGHVCNFYRALKNDPDNLAWHADNPTIHQDLQARQKWLVQWSKDNSEKLEQDPEFYDSKAAGWWAWGASNWTGSGWCIVPEDKRPNMPRGLGGQGLQAQRNTIPHIASEMGGQGVQAQRKELQGQIGTGERLTPWFQTLARRLGRVVILNRDWTSAVTPAVLREYQGTRYSVAIFLDPPYRTGHRKKTLYQSDMDGTSDSTAEDTWQWAQDHGHKYNIAYACRQGDIDLPADWNSLLLGFAGIRKRDRKEVKDMVAFSPRCETRQPPLFE